ncbi:mycothiol transferase [Geodermatophilus sp. SYSU D01119]
MWKLEGLSGYDVRRPLTATGTDLLGLLEHLACVQAGYLGGVMGRPFPEPMVWDDPDAGDDDLWVHADDREGRGGRGGLPLSRRPGRAGSSSAYGVTVPSRASRRVVRARSADRAGASAT